VLTKSGKKMHKIKSKWSRAKKAVSLKYKRDRKKEEKKRREKRRRRRA